MFIEKDSHNKSQGWIEVVCGSMFSLFGFFFLSDLRSHSQMHLYSRSQDIDHHRARATGQDDVGSALGRLDELLVHGLHKSLVMTQHSRANR